MQGQNTHQHSPKAVIFVENLAPLGILQYQAKCVVIVCLHVQEKRYEEAMAKFNTVLQVMGYRAGMYVSLHSTSFPNLLTFCSQPDTCYCLALCHYMLKQYASSLKYISEIIERGIKDHPELSVGMRTEGVDIRSVGNSLVCRYAILHLTCTTYLVRCSCAGPA